MQKCFEKRARSRATSDLQQRVFGVRFLQVWRGKRCAFCACSLTDVTNRYAIDGEVRICCFRGQRNAYCDVDPLLGALNSLGFRNLWLKIDF